MVRIRQGWLVVVLGLGLIAACKKDDKSSSASGDKTAEKADPGGGGGGGDDLALLPVDSEAVIGINFSQVQQSDLWKQLVEPKLMSGEGAKQVAELKAKCGGYDILGAVKSLSIGGKSPGPGGMPSGVLVAHGPDKAKTLDCIEKNRDEITKDGTQMTRDGDVVLIKGTKPGEQAAVSFLNGSTALIVFGDNADAAGIKAVAAGNSTLKSSPKFLEMYKKVNTGDSVWMLLNGKLLDNVPMGMKARAVYGSFNVTSGLALDLRVRFETPEQATQLATLANGQAAQAKAYVDKAEFTPEGNELHAAMAMSNQKLQALVTQLSGLMGALGGMGNMGTP